MKVTALAQPSIEPGARILRAAVDASARPLLATVPAAALDGALQVRRPPRPSYPLTVLRLEGGAWRRLATVEVALHAPHVQTLPGGRLLVVGSTSYRALDGRVEANAAVFGPDGSVTARFAVGDGVEDVQATAGGEIWVSYLDDGTMGDFGRFGWGRLSPEVWVEPVGGSGLRRFDSTGAPLYEFAPPGGVETAADCFALNVAEDGSAWISYHPGFPLVHVGETGGSAWTTGWKTVDALAISGDRVLHYGRFEDVRDTCSLAVLDAGGTLAEVRSFEPELSDGSGLGSARWVLGRGPLLHAVDDRAWHVLSLASL